MLEVDPIHLGNQPTAAGRDNAIRCHSSERESKVTTSLNDSKVFNDQRVEALIGDLGAILEEQKRPDERLLAIGAVGLNKPLGLAKPMVLLTPHAENLGVIAWSLVHETISRWGVDALKIELPLDAGARIERERVARAVTRDWIITEGPMHSDLAFAFGVTLAPTGMGIDPRIIVGAVADDPKDMEWHAGDAAHILIEHALQHGDPDLPDVLGPTTSRPAFESSKHGARDRGEG